jgi:hypothetical protein
MIDYKLENDKIAKFVGARIINAQNVNAYKWSIQDHTNPFYKFIDGRLTCATLHFHDDWNWLMPLVNTVYNTETKEYTLTKLLCMLQSALYDCDIDKVYNSTVACIDYIIENRVK